MVYSRIAALILASTLVAAPATASASDSQFEQVAASLEPGQLQPGSQGRSVERSAVDAPASAAAATDIQQATIADRTTNNAPSAQQRLTKVVVTRDRAKRTLTAQATFAASPTTSANSLVVVAAGAWNGNTCETRALMIGAAATADAAGSLIDPDLDLAVARTRSGATVTLTSAAHTRIGTEAWNCAYAYNTAPTDINSTYTGFYAEDLAVPKVPKLATSLGAPLQGDYKGTYSKVRVTVRNRGKGDATNVRVRLSGSGLKMLSTSKSLGTIEPNRSASHVFKVRVASGSKRTLTAKATATGGYAHSATTTMVIKPRPKKYASLTGRYFWGFRPDSALYNVGWMTRAVWFVNSTYAYVDFAKNGVKPTCTRTTTKCKRYTYNARTGVATIAGQRVTINTEGFTYKVPGDPTSSYFDPLYLPKKGARVATYLTHKTYHGNCILSCTAFTDRIELGTNGRFVKSSVALGSWPGIGGSWGSIPPDKRGTYRIISTGRIELKYATGTKQRRTIGYMLDLLGRSSPKNDGIMLGNTNYYREWN